jgi:hypothetical protein
VLEKATITLLPDRWHTRFAHTDAVTPGLLLRSGVALLLGAATHLLWDAPTHRGTFATEALPRLLGPTPGLPWLPVYHLLHALSSVAGVVILVFWARHLHRQPARSLIRPYRVSHRVRRAALWFLLAATVAVALAEWLPELHARYDVQLFALAVGGLSGFFIAWVIVGVGLRMNSRRQRVE